jgi:histidinol-phosphate phosphatase family protein
VANQASDHGVKSTFAFAAIWGEVMIDAILLSGGKGTRSEDPNLAKSLQQLTPGVRVIDSVASSLGSVEVGRIVAVLGHFNKEQTEVFSEVSWPAKCLFTSSIDMGTSHAVAVGLERTTADWVVVIAADSALCFDFSALLEFAEKTKSDIVVAARFSNHPRDSDALILGESSRIIGFRPKNQKAEGLVVSASGVVLVRRSILASLPLEGDFQENLLEMALKQEHVATAWISRFYCRDTGTPERIEQSRASFASGHAQFRGTRDIGAVFIDRDGTLVPNEGDARKRVLENDLPDEIAHAFRAANDCGVPIFIVTNQPGVAKGRITTSDVEQTFSDIQFELSKRGAVFDDFRYCVHHPEKGWEGELVHLKVDCNCRKPGGGMAYELASHHYIQLEKSWVIGDSDSDEGLAAAIRANFVRVNRTEPTSVAQAILKAIGAIQDAG